MDYFFKYTYLGSILEDVCRLSKEVFFQFGVDEIFEIVAKIIPRVLKWKPFGTKKEKIHCLNRYSGKILEIVLLTV